MSRPSPTFPSANPKRWLPWSAADRVQWLVGALALGAIVTQVTSFSLTIVGQKSTGGAPAPVLAVPPSPSLSLTPALGGLFGSPPAPLGAEVPSTRPLVLTAVIATSEPTRGFGIIGETAQITAMYAVGASLPDGARLIEVYAEHVVLDRAGQRETLFLPHAVLGPGNGLDIQPPAVVASAAVDPSPLEKQQRRIAELDESLTPVGRARILARGMGINEALRPGELDLRPSGRFQQSDGMRQGDVVVSVNGRDIKDVRGLVEALSTTLDSGGSMVVRRKGELVTLHLEPEY